MAGVKGMLRTPEHNAKIAAAHRGRVWNPEHRAKCLATLKARGWGGRRHGHASRVTKSPTWYSWSTMQERCTNPNATRYDRYGGRGIAIDPARSDFNAFLADMGERPAGRTLDRIDNDGNYTKANCRWATVQEQNKNRVYSTACANGCTCKRHHGRTFVKC